MLSEHDTPGVKPSSSSLKLEKAVDVAPLSSASTGTEEDPATGGPRTSSTSEAKGMPCAWRAQLSVESSYDKPSF